MRRFVVALLGAVVLVAGLGGTAAASGGSAVPASSAPLLSAPIAPGPGSTSTQSTALSLEQAQAAASGTPVEVTSQDTATSTTLVNPDGSTTVDLYSSPVRVQQGSAWAPVNTNLVANSAGNYATVATDASTVLSGGGAAPVASASAGGTSVGVGFGSSLPKPTVSGSVATYANVQPNTDLVVTATDGGFEYMLVLKSRPTTAPSFTVPLQTHGLSVSQSSTSGALTLTNSAGSPVFASSTPVMHGAAMDPHTDMPLRSEPLTTTVVQAASGPELKVTPDWSFLSDPTVTYPVTIDPDASLSQAHYDFTSSEFATSTYYDNSTSENGATGIVHVGTYNSGTDKNRGYFNFATGPIVGHTISSATLVLDEVWSYSCTAEKVDIDEPNSGFTSSLDWNNQPSAGPTVDTENVAKGYSSSCPGGNVSFPVTSMAQDWANEAAGNRAAIAVADDSTNNLYWKKFAGNDAHLSVNFANTPAAPTNVSATSGNKSISATWSAPSSNGGAAVTGYTVTYNPTTGSTVTDSVSGSARSDSASGLTNGVKYTVTVTATNSEGTGPGASDTATPATYPSAVTGLTAGGGNNRIHANWTAPSNNGGSPVALYLIFLYPGGSTWPASNWVGYQYVTGTSTDFQSGAGTTCNGTSTCTPTNGTAYDVVVFPVNSANVGAVSSGIQLAPGFGPPTTSNNATAQNYPSAPLNPAVTAVVAGQATVTWIAPTNTGGPGVPLVGYIVFLYPPGSAYPATPTAYSFPGPTASSSTLTGLTNGTNYTAYVWAYNNSIEQTATNGHTTNPGIGPAAVTGTAAVPGAPTNVLATAGPGGTQATVTWTAPSSNGGSAITSYTVSASPGSQTATTSNGTTLTATVGGLTPGQQYTFTVVATNANGNGAPSSPSNQVQIPSNTPSAPGSVQATAGPGSVQATVTWTAPSSNGGSAITSYTVSASPGSQTATTSNGTTLTATVGGLTPGQQYTFTVVATNANGNGAPSSPSNQVQIPSTTPSAPSNVQATAGDSNASVSWNSPNNGGSPITGYTVTTYRASDGTNLGTTSANSSPQTIGSLTDGTAYYFTVKATNSQGTGPESSDSNSVRPSSSQGGGGSSNCYNSDHCWGVDTTSTQSTSDLQQMNGNYGYTPDFVGRYISAYSFTPLSQSEANEYAPGAATNQGMSLLLIAAYYTGCESQADGTDEANRAVTAAQSLNVPSNGKIAIFKDIEAGDTATSDCMTAYAKTIDNAGYRAGFYIDTNDASTTSSFCTASQSSQDVANSAIYSSEPEPSSGNATGPNGSPSYNPTTTGCSGGTTLAWQYQETGTGSGYDSDEILPGHMDVTWTQSAS